MKRHAVIEDNTLEFGCVIAEKRFYEQKGKPVIIEIEGGALIATAGRMGPVD